MAELADMLSDLLSDPKTADKLRGLLGKQQGKESPSATEKTDKKATEQSGGLAELISSNPDALSSIARVLAGESGTAPDTLGGLKSALAKTGKDKSGRKDGGDGALSGLLQSVAGGKNKAGVNADMLAGLLGSLTDGEKGAKGGASALSSSGELAGLLGALSGGGGGLLPAGVDPDMLFKVTRAVAAMNSDVGDERTRLLYDLKPYISSARAKRVDEAAQMLRMLKVLDIFRDGAGNDGG